MDLKLFVYDIKGYCDTYINVENIYIKKVNNIKQLEISLLNKSKKILIPLKDIELCFNGEIKPIIIKNVDKTDLIQLILPIRTF